MTDNAISCKGLSKCYRLGAIGRHTLADECQYLWHKLRGRDPQQYMTRIGSHCAGRAAASEDLFWALREVSFDVKPGEVIGIIGRNGAGKSTLLKLLTRITEPTSGEAEINGRVASLLEVGTGFHPELTGRENIYLNGTILGMKKREIDLQFDRIVAFSELEPFLDTPVKRYSSGMYVRLAFAVAAHLTAEIMLIDEVLAVGDASFQRRCLDKMGELTSDGRTILFVSHNIASVKALCGHSIWLSEGKIKQMGACAEVVEAYLRADCSDAELPFTPLPCHSPCGTLQVEMIQSIEHHSDLVIQVGVSANSFVRRLGVGIEIGGEDQAVVLSQGAIHSGAAIHRVEGQRVFMITVENILKQLNGGTYTVRLWLSAPGTQRYVDIRRALVFNVEGKDPTSTGHVLAYRVNGNLYARVLVRDG